MSDQLDFFSRLTYKPPLVVCWGKGVDSTAMLVGMQQRGITPDMILFAQVGSEKTPTNEYNLDSWLDQIGFPRPVEVQYRPKNFKNWPHYWTLLENCLTNVTLPSIAYGFHSCSAKWKIDPMNAYLKTWLPAQECWSHGKKVVKAIGFEDSPHEHRRRERGSATFNIKADESDRYELSFPLQDWEWDRDRCKKEIAAAGLPMPVKSSCYFCTAMKPWEVDELESYELWTIVIMEARVRERNLNYARDRGWPRGEGVPLCEGLWRRKVKGLRGAFPKPGSMTTYIKEQKLLDPAKVVAVWEATPTHVYTRDKFPWDNWQHWIVALLQETIGEDYSCRLQLNSPEVLLPA